MALLKKTYYFIIKGVSEMKTKVFISERTLIIPGIISVGLMLPFYAIAISNPLGENTTFAVLINKVADVVIAIGIPIAALFIVYAGFLFVSARGSEEQITKAKTMFYWTVIGTMLVVGAKVIAQALESTIRSLQ